MSYSASPIDSVSSTSYSTRARQRIPHRSSPQPSRIQKYKTRALFTISTLLLSVFSLLVNSLWRFFSGFGTMYIIMCHYLIKWSNFSLFTLKPTRNVTLLVKQMTFSSKDTSVTAWTEPALVQLASVWYIKDFKTRRRVYPPQHPRWCVSTFLHIIAVCSDPLEISVW